MIVPDPHYLVALEELDPLYAAPLTDAGLTSYRAIKRSLPAVVGGSTVVVVGVGGLGHLAIQLLRALTPAKIIAIDARQDACTLAYESGAEHALLASSDGAAEILELSAGRGADLSSTASARRRPSRSPRRLRASVGS